MTTSSDDRDPVEELAEQFMARKRRGERPTVDEYAANNPHLADAIRDLFPALVMMEDLGDESRPAERPDSPVQEQSPGAAFRRLGDYRILRTVGRGGMGVVYEAEQESLGRRVALKVLPSDAINDPQKRLRFEREARSAARLHHTNIVPVFGIGHDESTYYYVMQFIQGLGLDEVIVELRRQDQARRAGRSGKQSSIESAPPTGSKEIPSAHGDENETLTAAEAAAAIVTGHFPQVKLGDGSNVTIDANGRQENPPGNGQLAASDSSVHLPGQTGHTTLTESGRHRWLSIARIGIQVAEALDYANDQGIVHRDIKPSNLLLDLHGTVWVTDFGLAKATSDVENLTHTGDIVGTIRYMAPERFLGRSDARSDIYSLGLTLYELLVLRPAFSENDRNKLIHQVSNQEPAPPRRLDPAMPRDLETIVLKAISRDPGHRYRTAGEMAADLKRFVEDRPILARRAGVHERLWRWCRRNPALAVATGIAAAFLVATSIVSFAFAVEQSRHATDLVEEQKRTGEQRDRAVDKSREATERAESLQRQLYINRVNLAYRECLANNVALAEKLLEGCPESRRGWEWSYCRRLCHLESLTIPSDPDWNRRVHDVAFSPDSTTIATANIDGTISLRNATTGMMLRSIGKRGALRFSLAISPDGMTIATGGMGSVKLWEISSGKELRSLTGPEGMVACVRFSTDGKRLAAASSTNIEASRFPEVKVWEVATGKQLSSFRHSNHWGRVELALSPHGQQVATVNEWETVVKLHEAAGGREVKSVNLGFGRGNSGVAYAPNGKLIAFACADGSVLFWNPASDAPPRSCRGHTTFARAVAFAPNGRLAASADYDGAIKLWEVATGREIANYRGHTTAILRLCFSPDGTRLASMGFDGDIKLWEVAVDPDVLTLRGYQGWAFRTAFSADGRRLVTAGFSIVRIRDADSGATQTAIRLAGGGVHGFALSPDGLKVATSGEFAQHFDLWDTRNGRHLIDFRGHLGRLRALAFSPDGTQIASASEDRTVRIWDARTGHELQVFRGHAKGVFGVTYSPDGRLLASMSWDGKVRVCAAAGGQELRSFAAGARTQSPAFGTAVAFSPDGRRLAAVAEQNQIILWDVDTGQESMKLAGHTRDVNAIAFSRDGRRLASAADDNTIKLWDMQTGEEVFTLRGHSHGVLGVAFSPDGARIASASKDATVKVWEALTPEPEVLRRRTAVAQADPEVLSSINNSAWMVVSEPNRPASDYQQALRDMENVCRLEPGNGLHLNTLGVAQYRVGRYQDALTTLTQSDLLNSASFKGSIPADLAFMAMAHHQLGHGADSQAFLTRLRDTMKKPQWRGDAESIVFLKEAESLLMP